MTSRLLVALGASLVGLAAPSAALAEPEVMAESESPPDPEQGATPMADPPPLAPPLAGYDKGFFLASGDGRYRLKIVGRLNAQATVTSTTAMDERTASGVMQIRRARLLIEGKLRGDLLAYKLQTEFGAGTLQLRDFIFDVPFGDGAKLRVGQWKRPFSRQQITGFDKLELIDRALTDREFFAGRDVGVALHNDYERSPALEWAVGLFSGTDVTPAIRGAVDAGGAVTGGLSNVPVASKPMAIARVGINRGGIKGYSEADLEGGPLRYAIAMSAMVEADLDRNSDARHRAELDFLVKREGFDASGGVYVSSRGTGLVDAQASDLAGLHLQGGYVVKGRWQPAARYAVVTALGDNTKATVHDVALGFNTFFSGHAGKLMVSAGARKTGDRAITDDLRLDVGTYLDF